MATNWGNALDGRSADLTSDGLRKMLDHARNMPDFVYGPHYLAVSSGMFEEISLREHRKKVTATLRSILNARTPEWLWSKEDRYEWVTHRCKHRAEKDTKRWMNTQQVWNEIPQ